MLLNQQQFLTEIDLFISEGQDILEKASSIDAMGLQYVNFDIYTAWRTKIKNFLELFLLPDNTYIRELDKLEKNNFSYAATCIRMLSNIKDHVEKGYISLPSSSQDVSATLNIIFSKFHQVAIQLRKRYNSRPSLKIEDEYDVQDLLRALFQLYFDDIRPEEYTPSYAGGSSRQDFLLKNEKIIIEVKKTRASMNDKVLGEQLIIDIEKYKSHPDCNSLICFVYDPERLLGNPQGIMNDLNTRHQGFAEVIIKPD